MNVFVSDVSIDLMKEKVGTSHKTVKVQLIFAVVSGVVLQIEADDTSQ